MKEHFSFYETKAREYLERHGYRIIDHNFRTRAGEIDIIAQDKRYTAFVEVKARTSGSIVDGFQQVDVRKQEKIKRAASYYAAHFPNRRYRFDVLSITEGGQSLRYELIKNAFD